MNPLGFFEEFEAVHFGHPEVGQHRVEARLGEHRTCPHAVFRLADLVPERIEKPYQAEADILLVVDDQQSGHQDCPPTGSCTMKRLPWPLLLSTKMRPPCASTMSL